LLNWQLPLLFEDYYTILQHIGNFQDTKGDMSDYLVSLTPSKKKRFSYVFQEAVD
jgi:hypothetical protein